MKPVYVYKYLPLIEEQRLKWFVEILKTGNIWFSKFHALNDPMEGVYYSYYSKLNNLIASKKNEYLIGSFGNKPNNFVLWAYYTNGYRGACIEIELNKLSMENIHKVKYCTNAEFNESVDLTIDKVDLLLKRKLNSWKNEAELRILLKKEVFGSDLENYVNVGTIKKVILGINIGSEAVECLRHLAEINVSTEFEWTIASPDKKELPKSVNLECIIDVLDTYNKWRENFSI